MGKFDGKVALITGGARGQGRAHAVALAREGADIVTCDIAGELESVPYPLGSEAELAHTVGLVESTGRRCVALMGDVRSLQEMENVAARALAEFGRIDFLLANAGIASTSPLASMEALQWQEMIDVNLTGVFHSFRAVVPHMIEQGYGRIVATSSVVARMGARNSAHYAAAKWGVIGLVKSLALEVAEHGITVNAVLPAGVNTTMIHNPATYRLLRPDLDDPAREDVLPVLEGQGPGLMEPEDVTAAVLHLLSDTGGFLNGEAMTLSAGLSASNAG
ncbi:mycofactocin-coupled SDR family oxidoreductase [Streptomyces sp. NPDC051098]|uniref:mycofactocin-coupled SDR family oxidoreductase n=1 Tax=Streptomyces sp. NPDC051098 TaxID=3155411 RepID=UPI00342BBEF4